MRCLVITKEVRNGGDYLIVKRLEEVLKHTVPWLDITLVNGWGFPEDEIDFVNSFDSVVIGGGPGYDNRALAPQNFPLLGCIDRLLPPIHMVGMGWYGVSASPTEVYGYRFTDDALKVLRRVERNGSYLGCRDYVTERVLRSNGFPNTIMTGDPAWYDFGHLDSVAVSRTVDRGLRRVVLSDPGCTKRASEHQARASQAIELAGAVRDIFPDAEMAYTFNGGIETKYSAPCNRAIKRAVETLGCAVYDLAGSAEGFGVYDDADVHIGYRVHSHIYCLSKRIPSVLIEEDARGTGVNEALGLRSIGCLDASSVSVGRFAVNPYLVAEVRDYIHEIIASDYIRFEAAFATMKRTYLCGMKKQLVGICQRDPRR